MDKSLLIYFNNIPLNIKELFLAENLINFNYNNENYSNLDEYISKEIIQKIEKKDIDIIYIKDNLSSNYLELYGLRLAYHIRLSKELGDKMYIPIIILSDIDGYTLNKLSSLARILFTKSIYLISNTKESMESFNSKEIVSLTEEEYHNEFLNLIEVSPPENSSNHSIANEWAIFRWAKFLKVASEAIIENKDKIASMLYFKYLLACYPEEDSKAIGYKTPKKTGKILYIDDEWAKGWSDIYEKYFPNDIIFNTYKGKFENIDELQSGVSNEIESNMPDIVILDLRLVANEHSGNNRDDLKNYSGIKLAEKIKKINPGIQIMMFTATGNSLILEELYKHNILGYIKKGHPKDKSIKTKESFKKLATLVDEGFEKKYLKEVWSRSQDILHLELFQQEEFKTMKFEIESIFEILNSNIDKKYTYAMLSIFQSLEEINNYYIDDKTKNWHKESKCTISVQGNGYTKDKIKAILKKLEILNEFDSDINEIAKMRNNAIHPPQKGTTSNPTKDNILTWVKMLQTILKKIEK